MQQLSFLPGEMTPGERSLIQRALKTLDRHLHEPGVAFTSTRAAREWLILNMAGLEREEFRVLYLNNQNQLIAGETLFTGTINRTEVHPREVIKRALYHNAAAVVLAHNHPSGEVTPSKGRPPYHGTSGTGTGPGGYPGAGPSDSRWQPGFLLCRTWSALTLHNHITPVFTFIFCLQRYPIMKIITRGEAMRIHQQHPTSRLFPFCTGKYRWHGSAEAYTGREVQDIPGVLAVFAERRKDSFGPYVRLMSVTLN
ncbi:putative DNA repair protein [Escherichia coli]|uniref:Putative DNA repair protein n=2 Tax=Gammaproteobacteria TaxID=1236 RepID=A0A377BC34_ECOLX|nr:putative DNA repair protein [Escherichia coli]